jgi:hypothetical protein
MAAATVVGILNTAISKPKNSSSIGGGSAARTVPTFCEVGVDCRPIASVAHLKCVLCETVSMTTYTVTGKFEQTGFHVAIAGSLGHRQTILGFATKAAAEAWITHDKRLTDAVRPVLTLAEPRSDPERAGAYPPPNTPKA